MTTPDSAAPSPLGMFNAISVVIAMDIHLGHSIYSLYFLEIGTCSSFKKPDPTAKNGAEVTDIVKKRRFCM